MEKSIKYVNYEVKQNDNVVSSGKIPSILTFSGSGEFFNLGGMWLWFTYEDETILEINDGNSIVKHSSKRKPESYVNYITENFGTKLDPY